MTDPRCVALQSRLIESVLSGITPDDVRDHLAGCDDCGNDALWIAEIRDEIDVRSFPCSHLAYACSSRANHAIVRELGMFKIVTDRAAEVGIVIGHCPWCGIVLNVSAASALK